MSEGGKAAVQADEEVVSISENRALKKRVRELERLLDKKTMEVEITQGVYPLVSNCGVSGLAGQLHPLINKIFYRCP